MLARVRAGEVAAYAELVAAHAGVATRLAALHGAGSEAEDVVQEAFVKAYAALPTFRPGAPFRPWLLRIVVNETRNLARGEQRRRVRDDRAARLGERTGRVAGPEDRAELTERQRAVHAAVRTLPDPFREVVVCRYLMDLSESETAELLDLPAGTVKSRLHRAVRLLREELADD